MPTTNDDFRRLRGYARATAIAVSSADQVLSPACDGIWVGNTSTLVVDTAGGDTQVTFVVVVGGSSAFLPVRATKVYHSGSTANNCVAVFDNK